MRKINIIFLFIFYLCFQHNVWSQSIAINNTGVVADTTAILDITSTDKGLLIPRLTIVQRDAIVNPAQSLLIYNITTQCYEFWENNMWQSLACACTKPAAAGSISGNANVCQGSGSESYSIAPVSDATSYVWQYSGTGFSIVAGNGTNSITTAFSPTATAGNLTVYGTNTCGNGTAQFISITVTAPPTTADAGTDINPACDISTATLAGNTPTVGTGSWSVVSGTATITTPSSPTSGVTGLTVPGTATLRWTISNPPCTGSYDEVVINTTACGPSCGSQIWMSANMNVGTRINGASNQNNDSQVEKYCYNDIEANCDIYGGLYQWAEAMQISYTYNTSDYPTDYTCDPCGSSGRQGICPTGYHIPTDLEWSRYEWCIETTIAPTGSTSLATFQTTTGWRGSTTAGVGPGAKMKVTSINTPAWNGTNTSGFSAVPAGFYQPSIFSDWFNDLGNQACFWSATKSSTSEVWNRALYIGPLGFAQSYRINNNPKKWGYSVRCLKD